MTEKSEKQTISLVTQNIWLFPEQFLQRLETFTDKVIPQIKPDILCVQEVFQPVIRNFLKNKFQDDYHIITSNHFSHSYRWYSYIPFAAVVLLAILAKITFLYILLPFLLPHVVKFLLIRWFIAVPDKVYNPEKSTKYDWQGLQIYLKKSEFSADYQVLKRKPFENVGYLFPKFDIQFVHGKQVKLQKRISDYLYRIFYFYIQMTFLRPGFMLVKTKHLKTGRDVIIGTCHLVICGPDNKRRILQVQEMYDNLKQYENVEKQIICGDFNTIDRTQEIKYLEQKGFTDCYKAKNPNSKGYTWDNNNPFTKLQEEFEEDSRIDYIFHKDTNKSSDNIINTEIISNVKGLYCSDHYGIKAQFNI